MRSTRASAFDGMTLSERYDVERPLGRGGMATVYLARDSVLGRRVALKVLAEHLTDDESFRARFFREARLAARVTHANVVQVYDLGEDGRRLFIAMEYVEGESLAEELERRGALPSAEVAAIGSQLCAALEAAHAAGLVHRDVKPQNVLRARDGTVKLADFGIARSHDSTVLTQHGSVLGTAAYLAPEQARGEQVTAAADLYSVGVVLYEALTGRKPYQAATLPALVLERERQPVMSPSALVSGVSPALDATVVRELAVRPEDRPPSASALATELHGGSDLDATAVLAARPLPRTPPRRGRRALLAVTALLALGALGLVLAIASTGDSTGATRSSARKAPATHATTFASHVSTSAAALAPIVQPSPAPSPACVDEDGRDEDEHGGHKRSKEHGHGAPHQEKKPKRCD
jgi:eukaryotic-like serine/threonine-protein kinase